VKIAVPVAKMSREDLDYVERLTGTPLNGDKSSGQKRGLGGESGRSTAAAPKAGASVDPSRKEHDWFQFFLDCEVNPQLCERYSQAFLKESMDESILSDVDTAVLRTLGLREGDIIKVMRVLDSKFGRTGAKNKDKDTGDGQGGLFSGPGGALRNNTRKGRPAPAVPAGDVVDPKAFSKSDGGSAVQSPSTAGGGASSATTQKSGFDDDAWDVKPVKQSTGHGQSSKSPTPTPPEASAPAPQAPPTQNLTGSMQELSLLSAPLQPSKSTPVRAADDLAIGTQSSGVASQPSATQGASPSFFAGVAQQIRQRPQAPQAASGHGALQPPPPSRPLSAPQSAQPSAFTPPPLGPQMTGSVHASLQGQVAPPGQSLGEIRVTEHYTRQLHQQQQQMQQMQQQLQHMQHMQPQPTGAYGMQPSVGFMQPMPTGMGPGMGLLQAQATGFPTALQPQATGYPQQNMGGGVNSYLPPPLEPLRTGVPAPFPGPQPTLAAASGPAPLAPLVPQQTGPPPPVRFGVLPEAPKLMPQATGRRANLSQASK